MRPVLTLGRGDDIRSLNGSDSSTLFLVKTLLYPVTACVPVLASALARRADPLGPYFILCALTFLVSNIVLDVAVVHRMEITRSGWPDFLDILIRWTIIVVVVGAILYAGELLKSLDPSVLLVWTVFTPVVLWCALRIAQLSIRRILRLRPNTRKAVIVGASDVGLQLERVLQESPVLRTIVRGFFEDRSLDRVPSNVRTRVLGRCSDLAEFVRQGGADVVYIAIPMSRQQRVLDLLGILSDSTASIYFVPDLLIFNAIQGRVDTLEGLPLIAVCESPFIGLSGLIKRAMDLVMSCVLILITLPLFLLVALGVHFSSPGPVIFRQMRYGLDGRPIKVLKFRSMRVSEDGHGTYTQVIRRDPRVTRFGALIRKTSLDELPQLFNVFEGSMSLVGPRPHVVDVNERYRKLIPGYMIRHKVKPGITGLAQVNGFRGGDDIGSMSARINHDLNYLRQWSVGLDIAIILKTTSALLGDRKAY